MKEAQQEIDIRMEDVPENVKAAIKRLGLPNRFAGEDLALVFAYTEGVRLSQRAK